jgi:hypothetical protein
MARVCDPRSQEDLERHLELELEPTMKPTRTAVHTALVALMAIIVLLGHVNAVAVDRGQYYRGLRSTADAAIKRSALFGRGKEATTSAHSLTKRAPFNPNGPPVWTPSEMVNSANPQHIFDLGWLFRAGEGTDPIDPAGAPLLRFHIDQRDDGAVTADDLDAIVNGMDDNMNTGFRAVPGDTV